MRKTVTPQATIIAATQSEPSVMGHAAEAAVRPTAGASIMKAASSTLVSAARVMRFINFRPIRTRPSFPPQEDRTPLPIVSDVTQQTIFDDRFDANIKWYLPSFEIVDPEERFFFITDNGRTSKDEPMFSTKATLTYREVEPPELVASKQALLESNSQLSFVKISIQVKEIGLTLSYGSVDKPATTPVQYGTILSDNQVVFQISDDEEISYGRLFYANLSNFRNDNRQVTFLFSVTFEGWASSVIGRNIPVESMRASHSMKASRQMHAPRLKSASFRPEMVEFIGILPETRIIWFRKSFTKENIAVSKRISCSSGGNYLYQPTGREAEPCGCNPPWSMEYTSGIFYQRYLLPNGLGNVPLNAQLFQQISQPQIFLVIPNEYCISLDDDEFVERNDPDEYSPDILLTSLINPNPGHEAENTIRLDMVLKPNLTPMELQLLKQVIMEDLGITPEFKCPYELGINYIKNFEEDSSGVFDITQGATGFKLSFQSKEGKFPQSLINLAQISDSQAMSLGLALQYEIDRQNKQASLLKIHLKKTIGDVTKLQLNDEKDELVIRNHAYDPIQVKGLLFYTNGEKGFSFCDLPNALDIPAKQEAIFNLQNELADLLASIQPFKQVAAQYDILEDDERLQEIRLNMDLRTVRIPISVTSFDAALHNVTALQVNMAVDFLGNLQQMPEPLTKTITPVEGVFVAGDEAPFILTYPLSYDAVEGEKTLNYSVSIQYTDKPAQKTRLFTQNFGDNARIFITADILKPENLV